MIADQIKQTFLDNLHKLSPYNQGHFMIRLYRITGDRNILDPVVAFFFSEKNVLLNDIKNFNNYAYKKFAKGLIPRPLG